jgi:hypothetical protein
LNDDLDTAAVLRWLRGAEQPTALTQIRRTSQDGLLRVAGALRNGSSVCAEIKEKARFLPCHVGDGFRMVEPHGKAGNVAWAVADELSKMGKFTVVLTPDAKSPAVHAVVSKLQNQIFSKKGQKMGPFPITWERKEEEEAAALLGDLAGGRDDAAASGESGDRGGSEPPQPRHLRQAREDPQRARRDRDHARRSAHSNRRCHPQCCPFPAARGGGPPRYDDPAG